MTKSIQHNISTLEDLSQTAKVFSQQISPGDVINLDGDLGAGKTTFTQYLLDACGVKSHVKSPTYILYETYQSDQFNFVHMDLYRLVDPEELYFLGIEELLDQQNILIIEWPSKGVGVLPKPNFTLSFSMKNLNRTLTITSD